MTQRIIKVRPTEESFALTWQLSTRCNYDCMYCSPDWHDDHSQHHSLEIMQQAWQKIFDRTQHLGLRYKIAFTGGELTVNKQFLPFVCWLRENYDQHLFQILVTTNGSASLNYYTRLFEQVDNLSFSVHSEHIDEQKFFDMVVALRRSISANKFLQVIIMDEHWNRDRIPLYTRLLDTHDISYVVNEIDHSFQTRTFPIMRGRLNLAV